MPALSHTSVRLFKPIELNGETVAEVHVRRPEIEDIGLLNSEWSAFEKGAALITILSGVPLRAVYALSDDDLERVGTVVTDLLSEVV